MASAWQQVEGILKANQTLRQAQLARSASQQIHETRLQRGAAGDVVTLTAPLHATDACQPYDHPCHRPRQPRAGEDVIRHLPAADTSAAAAGLHAGHDAPADAGQLRRAILRSAGGTAQRAGVDRSGHRAGLAAGAAPHPRYAAGANSGIGSCSLLIAARPYPGDRRSSGRPRWLCWPCRWWPPPWRWPR